ncbi:MAG: ZIP family metal transporter [Clostridiaceae bacterium]|nr:ZIP family metal transporter [Clostridiaceae bacterium]
MNDQVAAIISVLLLFVGTTLGSGLVFIMKDQMNELLERGLLGFASGVMVAASVWSLLIPGVEMAEEMEMVPWFPAVFGFLLGVGCLLILNSVVPHINLDSDEPEGVKSNIRKSMMLFMAVTLHNIPEGMAVGVVVAGMLSDSMIITQASTLVLALGIAIQNFPEGAIISMPLKMAGYSKKKAFSYGFISGVVEPISSIITIFLTFIVKPILPYVLAFAAGAMIYVVVEELIPAAQSGKHANVGTIGFGLGFALMMLLDISLG